MLTSIRTRFGKIVVFTIIGLVTFVFVFFGVFSPKSTRGMHENAVAGTVNGEPIGIPEFRRELARRVEFFKNMSGGKLSEEQLAAFRIRESVFNELARRKVLIQEASRYQIEPSAEEIRTRIRQISAFQKNGQFDFVTYKEVLAANNYSPSHFERMVREDAILAQWEVYFRNRLQVGQTEVEREFKAGNFKRGLKFVLIPPDAGRKSVVVSGEQVAAYLKDPAKLNLVKGQFEARKDTDFKGKKFEDATVQAQLARENLSAENVSAVQKANDALAEKVLGLLKPEKGADAAVNAVVKGAGLTVKTTGLVASNARFFPGIGESKELVADVFKDQSPLDPKAGGKAKVYRLPQGTLVAIIMETTRPDQAKLESERETIARQILAKKSRTLFEDWLKKVSAKAKIDQNPAVVGENGVSPNSEG